MAEVRMGYADTGFGQMHYAECGAGAPVVLLHQSPRSWDEFREVLPLLGEKYRAIAVDMAGFGSSPKLPKPQHIDTYADSVWQTIDALGLERPVLIGHHTGGLVALEMSVQRTDVMALVLSSCPWAGPEYREEHLVSVIDDAPPDQSGGHLDKLWGMRAPHYPDDRWSLLNRFLADALRHGVDPAEGHRACGRYHIEDRIARVTAPTLVMSGSSDPFSLPAVSTLAAALVGSPQVHQHVIEGGTVALMEQCPSQVAQAVDEFLAGLADGHAGATNRWPRLANDGAAL